MAKCAYGAGGRGGRRRLKVEIYSQKIRLNSEFLPLEGIIRVFLLLESSHTEMLNNSIKLTFFLYGILRGSFAFFPPPAGLSAEAQERLLQVPPTAQKHVHLFERRLPLTKEGWMYLLHVFIFFLAKRIK